MPCLESAKAARARARTRLFIRFKLARLPGFCALAFIRTWKACATSCCWASAGHKCKQAFSRHILCHPEHAADDLQRRVCFWEQQTARQTVQAYRRTCCHVCLCCVWHIGVVPLADLRLEMGKEAHPPLAIGAVGANLQHGQRIEIPACGTRQRTSRCMQLHAIGRCAKTVCKCAHLRPVARRVAPALEHPVCERAGVTSTAAPALQHASSNVWARRVQVQADAA